LRRKHYFHFFLPGERRLCYRHRAKFGHPSPTVLPPRQPVAPSAVVPILLPAVGVANLMFRILANLQFGEDLEQSSLSEHGEDGVLRVVD
jgi:hypothetical protein